MVTKMVTVPELGMIAGTRVALGAGLGLLLAGRLKPEQRRAIGWTLLAVGAISTVPLAFRVLSRQRIYRVSAPSISDQDNDVSTHADDRVTSRETL